MSGKTERFPMWKIFDIIRAWLGSQHVSGDRAVVHLAPIVEIPSSPEKPEDFLLRMYCDIAETDPQSALKMLRDELESCPPKEMALTLMRIEKYIRQTYCHQYFAGMRMNVSNENPEEQKALEVIPRKNSDC